MPDELDEEVRKWVAEVDRRVKAGEIEIPNMANLKAMRDRAEIRHTRRSLGAGVLSGMGLVGLFVLLNQPGLIALLVHAWARLTGVVWLICVGNVLYRFKKAQRMSYGTLEMFIAAIVAYDALPSLSGSTNTGAFVRVAGALYVFVRGLDNFAEGRKEHQRRINADLLKGMEKRPEALAAKVGEAAPSLPRTSA